MARVKDLWFSVVPVKDADGKTVKGEDGRARTERRKTSKHPDNTGNKDAKRWLAIWLDPDDNEKTKAFAKKTDAQKYADKMEADAIRGDYVDPDAGKGKFGPLARTYLKMRKVSASSRRRYESTFTHHVEPAFGHRALKGIKPSEVVEWLNGPLIAPFSFSVQNQAYDIVRGTLALAVADKMIRENPAESRIVSPPRPGDPKPRPVWDMDTVWKVINAHPERYRVIPVCEAGLGLREGCAFGLAADDFDFEAGKVHIRRQVVRHEGRMCVKLPKGGKERTVPLPRGVAGFVKAHTKKYPPVKVALPWLNEDETIADEPVTVRLLCLWDGPVTHGQPINATTYIAHVWLRALSGAGLAPPPERDKRGYLRYKSPGREFGQHMLRHVYETMLDEGGVPLAGMMEFMGHSRKSHGITLGVYAHVTEETFERGRQAVDANMFKLRPVESGGTVTELRAAQ